MAAVLSTTANISSGIQDQVRGQAIDPERSDLKSYFKCLAASIGVGMGLTRNFTSKDTHILTASIFFWTAIIISLISPLVLASEISYLTRKQIIKIFSILAMTCTVMVITGLGILVYEVVPEGGAAASASYWTFLVVSISALVAAAYCLEIRPPEEKRSTAGMLFLRPFHVFSAIPADRPVTSQERYQKSKSSLQGYFAILAGYQGTIGTTSYAVFVKIASKEPPEITSYFAWASSLGFIALVISLVAQMMICNLDGQFSLQRRICVEIYGTVSMLTALVAVWLDAIGREKRGGRLETLEVMSLILGWIAASAPAGFFFFGDYIVKVIRVCGQWLKATFWRKRKGLIALE